MDNNKLVASDKLKKKINIIKCKVKTRTGKLAWSLFRAAFLIGLSYIVLFPLLFSFSTFMRSYQDTFNNSIVWIPRHVTFDNILLAMDLMRYYETLINTVAVSCGSAIIQVFSAALVGYGFARFKFKGSGLLFSLVLFTIIIPPSLLNISLFTMNRYFDFFFIGKIGILFTGKPFTINLIDTYWPFFIQSFLGVGLRGGLFIYIFRQIFKGMPNDLENAAIIDGCGRFRAFWKVMLPCAGSAILIVFIFSFIWHWTDYFVTSALLTDKMNLSQRILSIRTLVYYLNPIETKLKYPDYGSREAIMQAASFLTLIPPLLVFIFAQKYFIKSIERSGIVG